MVERALQELGFDSVEVEVATERYAPITQATQANNNDNKRQGAPAAPDQRRRFAFPTLRHFGIVASNVNVRLRSKDQVLDQGSVLERVNTVRWIPGANVFMIESSGYQSGCMNAQPSMLTILRR